VIEMFRRKLFDWTRTVCFFSNAWSHINVYRVDGYIEKPLRLIERRDREAFRRTEFSREMAMAAARRIQQTIR
jgi:hypothetical protein